VLERLGVAGRARRVAEGRRLGLVVGLVPGLPLADRGPAGDRRADGARVGEDGRRPPLLEALEAEQRLDPGRSGRRVPRVHAVALVAGRAGDVPVGDVPRRLRLEREQARVRERLGVADVADAEHLALGERVCGRRQQRERERADESDASHGVGSTAAAPE
jgi:hypothetical protein